MIRNVTRRDRTFQGGKDHTASVRWKMREKKNSCYWEEYLERNLKVMG